MTEVKVILTFEHERSVGSNEHGAGTSTAGRSARALSVNGNVTANDKGVAAVPGGRLDPVYGVEESSGGAVASVLGVHTLDISVAVSGEKVHEEGLGGL